MLSHWPSFTWKFFMIWFHKMLKLIFQTQPSCHRNICTEHWRKLPNLTLSSKFSCTLRTRILQNMCKMFCELCCSFIFKIKLSFYTAYGRSGCFEFLFWFGYVILLSKIKCLFFSLWKVAIFSKSFWKHNSVLLQILHQ